MKVERKDVGFTPVTITLESQFEVDVLHDLVGRVVGDGEIRDTTENLYHCLQGFVSDSEDGPKVVGGYFLNVIEACRYASLTLPPADPLK